MPEPARAPRGRGRLRPGLRGRALPAGRPRRRRARARRRPRGRRRRRTSSPDFSRPATIRSSAARRLSQIPIPRPTAGWKGLGDVDQADEDKDRRGQAEGRDHDPVGHARRQLDAEGAEREQEQNEDADREDELPDRARVPAEHGQVAAQVAGDRVPTHEGAEREDEPAEPGEELAGAPEPGAARAGSRRTCRGERPASTRARALHSLQPEHGADRVPDRQAQEERVRRPALQ